MFPRTTATLLVPLLACAAEALAQRPQILLEGVPARLAYPLPDGTNAIVTATVTAAEPTQVWLSKQPDDEHRLMLAPSAAGRYQVNLADDAVRDVLRHGAERGSFAIHARSADGEVVSSAPVSFTFLPQSLIAPIWVIRTAAGSRTGRALPGEEQWVDVGDVRRLEWYVAGDEELEPLAIEVRGERREGSPDEDARMVAFDVDDELRAAWSRDGALDVLELERPIARLLARPGELAVDEDGEAFEVRQRSSAALPGSNGYLSVSLGDITGGRVAVVLRDAEGRVHVRQRLVGEGDAVTFRVGGAEWVIGVEVLVNRVIGEDHAELVVTRPESWERLTIARFLEWLPTTDVVFVRNGGEHDPGEAAAHLRRKYDAVRDRITTFDAFLENIASRSSTTGEPYRIRFEDGSTTEAGPWLRENFRRHRGRAADASESR